MLPDHSFTGKVEITMGSRTARVPAVALIIMLVFCAHAWAARVKPLPNQAWGEILATRVVNGLVDYAGIKKHPELLKTSIRDFEKISRQAYGKWNRKTQIAFWINAHNLFTIKTVVDHYPPEGKNLLYPKRSIRQIGGIGEKAVFRAAGRLVSLDQIENEILSGIFKDSRVPFALARASLGAPPLPSSPFSGENLDEMLDRQVLDFLEDPRLGMQWEGKQRKLLLSKIFLWHEKDFGYYYTVHKLYPTLPIKRRNMLNFIWGYIPEELKTSLKENPFEVSFLDYDWSLNGLGSE